MWENISLDNLHVPLAWITQEDQKVCQGHKEIGKLYKERKQAKDAGFEWIKENENSSLYEAFRFEVDMVGKKHQLTKFFTHQKDIQSCDCFAIETVFRSILLENRQYVELAPGRQIL